MSDDNPGPAGVKQQVLDRIGDSGPMPFDEFMRLALYGPGGFFAGETLRSVKAGDFLTSPEVSPLFGATLASFAASERDRIGEPFRVVDVGAGSGSLLSSLLSEEAIEAWAVEVSPPARAQLETLLPADRVVGDPEDGVGRGVVIANELIDNLPMAVAVRRGSGWAELMVVATAGQLEMTEMEPRQEVADWAERFSGPVDEGGLVEVQLEAADWLGGVLELMGEGALVVIDYGATADELASRRVTGTLRTYRAHHLGPEPLAEPGLTDITADVNFTALMETAAAAGPSVDLHRQDDFLVSWGLRDAISRLREEELRLARSGDELARLQTRSHLTGAEALLNPRGLGDFRVLVARL
ncbi:MAG: SAM-dependent methyltransferase [Acidimicrobiia bacterium]